MHHHNFESHPKTSTNFLPSVSLIYALTDDINIRGAFSKTLARPSFREKSDVFIDDPVSDIIFNGNINVRQAEINNYDLRGEYFFRPGEMISLSVFYKDFTDHIALVVSEVVPNEIIPRNVSEAYSYGLEFELRKRLDFISPVLSNFSFGTNVSLIESVVDRRSVVVSETGTNEYESEVNFTGSEEGVDEERRVSLQAPFSINGFINYEPLESGITANVSYNVQGETLTYVSSSEVPEVYTRPFHSLNFRVSKIFGEEQKSSLSLSVKNILDDEQELFYQYEDVEEIFSLRRPGTTFSIGYTYNF